MFDANKGSLAIRKQTIDEHLDLMNKLFTYKQGGWILEHFEDLGMGFSGLDVDDFVPTRVLVQVIDAWITLNDGGYQRIKYDYKHRDTVKARAESALAAVYRERPELTDLREYAGVALAEDLGL